MKGKLESGDPYKCHNGEREKRKKGDLNIEGCKREDGFLMLRLRVIDRIQELKM